MFSLEKLSHKIINTLYKNSDIDELTKAKAEYGLSLLLGIFIELFFCLFIAFFLDLFWETLLLMSFSLIFRIFVGGAHCSSYSRCLFFTILFYIFFSYLAKYICIIFPDKLLYGLSLLFLILLIYIFKNKFRNVGKILFLDGMILISFWLLGSKADYMVIINLGILIQSLIATDTGSNIVKNIDVFMEKTGI